MSERSHHRRPATFKLDDPGVVVMDPEDSSRPPRGTVHVTPEFEPAALPVPVEAPVLRPQRGFRWGAVFWTAIGGLILLGLGLGVTRLIEDLFARSEGLGTEDGPFAFEANQGPSARAKKKIGAVRIAGHRVVGAGRVVTGHGGLKQSATRKIEECAFVVASLASIWI